MKTINITIPATPVCPGLPEDFTAMRDGEQWEAVAQWLGISLSEAALLVHVSRACNFVADTACLVTEGDFCGAALWPPMAARSMAWALVESSFSAGWEREGTVLPPVSMPNWGAFKITGVEAGR